MPLSKSIALAALSFTALLFTSGQALADVNFVAPGVAGSVTNLSVGGNVYDVTFVGNVSHTGWASQLDFSSESEAEAAIVALAAELNAAGATNTRYTTNGGTFDITTGQLWYDADAVSLFGESLIRSGSLWRLANPLPGGSTAPLNGSFPFALDFTLASAPVPTASPLMVGLLILALAIVGLGGIRALRNTEA